MMKYWKMKLTCQSPVHIGSGDIYQKNQYVYEEDGKRAHIYFLNESKWAEFLENEKLLDSFVSEIQSVNYLQVFSSADECGCSSLSR